MQNKINHFLISTYSFFIFFVTPIITFAQWNIWEGAFCGADTAITTGGPTGSCSFCDALVVTSNIIDILFNFAIIFGVIMIVVGGVYMMVTSASEQNVSKGKKIITSAVVGVIIALLAWVIVNTIISVLAGPNSGWNNISC